MRDRRSVEPESFGGLAEVPADHVLELVFLRYTREVFAATQHWTESHQIFSGTSRSPVGYDQAVLA